MSGGTHRGVSSRAIGRPIGTVALWSVVVVLGGFYVTRLPLDLLPQIIYPQIRVSVNYPSVAPEVIEEQVTKVLETGLATTENLVRLESETEEGRAAVNLHFRYGTDINFALQDASKNLDRARARLPEDAEPPTIFKFDPSQIPVFEVGFSSSQRSPVALRDWVDLRLRPLLLTVEGIASVNVSGGLRREVHVTLDQERLRSYGLAVADVLEALRDANQDVAAGNVTSPSFELVGKTEGKFVSVEDIRRVLLSVSRSRPPITLGDVARVEDTHGEQRLWVRLDGVPAVEVSVRKQPDANTVAVARGVRHRLEQLEASHFVPGDVRYEVTTDQSFFIETAVRGVRNAALAGAGLAMLVVFLFLGSVRKTLIIGLSIPLAVLAAFMMMGLGDLTLNIMSLGGLALGVGMLVDNAIVMLENIFRHRELGAGDPEEAAHRGAGEVTSAVVASTATSLAAVVPFLLITGLAALIFRELILTISFAMLASLGTALTLVPMLAAQLGKVRRTSGLERSRAIQAFDAFIERLRVWYRRVVTAAVRRRGWVLGGAFGTLALVLLLIGSLGREFLPAVDDGNVSVRMQLPPGTAPQRTNDVTHEVERLVTAMPHVRHVFTTAGGYLFGGTTAERSGRASIDVMLDPAPARPDWPAGRCVNVLQRRLDSLAIPGARLYVRPPRIRGLRTNVSGSDVAIGVQGDDLAELQRIGAEVMRRLQGIRGLESVEPSTQEASPQLVVALDRERAAGLRLNVAEVGQAVRVALDGAIATRFTEGNQEYDLRVRLPRDQFQNPEDLGSIALFAGRNRPVYVRDVATVQRKTGPSTILRSNQNREYRITGDVNDALASVGEVNREIAARLGGMVLPDGYGLVYGGEEETIRENQRNLTIVTVLAVFLVWVVMAVQYESVTNPLVILSSVPLALVGVVLMLWLTSTALSAPALLGVILLAGIVVNNAILLVEYVELARRERGLAAEDAVVDAGATRLRPILMTTATTVLGMLPLAIGVGEGTELMRPLALSVVGGLSVSTVLTLIVVPCAYLALHGVAERLRLWVIGGAPAAAGSAAD